ncbi:MAG: hypothetical protein IJN52_01965 [Bacteroidales bacterium]|nr:hypothetical protein [Bacteroidales bacterium]
MAVRYGSVGIDCQSLIVVVLSSLIVLILLKILGVRGSAAYALIGSLEACRIGVEGSGDISWLLSFLVAPVLSLALSFIVSLLLRRTLGRSHIHLLTLSYHMRLAVIFCLILTAFALGINWGGFLMAGASYVSVSSFAPFIVSVILILAVVTMSPFMRDSSDEYAGEYGDFSIYTVLSAGMATAVTLVVFSFDAVAGLAGLKAVPLSVGALVYASIAGAELAGRSHMIEMDRHFKELAAMFLTPSGSLLIAYLIMLMTGEGKDSLMNYAVLSSAMIVLVALVFFGYARRQRRQKEMTERLVRSQQQQIYENSRALNDMQLKVVISENQALHDAVEMKRQEVMNVALSIVEQREYLESLSDIVKKLSVSKDEKEREELVSELGTSLKQRLSYDRDVDTAYFYAQAESLHEDFSAKLAENFPDLTQQEKRLATLLRLGFSSKYISTLMNITVKSVEISRYRLRQKLGLSKGDNLVNFIKSI